MIVGLCSSYREGRLAESAVRSLLAACDSVVVVEGAIAPPGETPEPGHDWTGFQRRHPNVLVKHATATSDAAKRTVMLELAKRKARPGEPLWGVILDGDELLVDGHVLPEYFDAIGPDALGFSLHLMELDGSCSYIPNRVLRLDRISAWAISSYAFVVDGVTISKPNVKILAAGEPDQAELVQVGESMRQRRRPLHGEPHILHRSVLRSPERQQVRRQHEAEADSFGELVAGQPVGEQPEPGGARIWLPG